MTDRVIMGANWWNDTLNCRKRMESAQLPSLKRARDAFVAGGGFFRVSLPQEIEELEARLNLRGSHDDIRGLFGREPGDWTTFYYYERLRDLMAGKNYGRVVTLKGLVMDVEQPRVQGKKADTTNFTMGCIVLYHDVVDGKTVHKFDFDKNGLIINGVDYGAEHNRLIAA